jgi:hypothetical protein
MDYTKAFLGITIATFLLALFIIGNVMSLETTWLGIYNSEGDIQEETKNEYSKTFFTKRKCENWIKKRKKINPDGLYVCAENCKFIVTGLINCDKLFEY